MAIRNAGKSANMKAIKLNKVSVNGKCSALKSRTTHSRARYSQARKNKKLHSDTVMGLDTKIYSNHNLIIPNKSEEVVELLMQLWKGRTKIHDKYEVAENDMTSDVDNYEIFVNPKLIEFELSRFNQIPISTNFKFTMNIYLYLNTICVTPIGIGRNATNMIAEFMDEPFGIYEGDLDSFNRRKSDWNLFKLFHSDITSEIGVNKHLWINNGQFEGIGDLALDGATLEDMINQTMTITRPCESREQFVENHTWIRPDGIRNIKGDVWFYKKENTVKKEAWL